MATLSECLNEKGARDKVQQMIYRIIYHPDIDGSNKIRLTQVSFQSKPQLITDRYTVRVSSLFLIIIIHFTFNDSKP